MAVIVQFDWSGVTSVDFSTGLGLPEGATFDPAFSLARIGGGFSAQQFDVYGAGSDTAIVRVRGPDGSELPPGDRVYLYIPGLTPQGLAVFGGAGGRNLTFLDGSQFVVGDGALGTSGDDLPNLIDFSQLLPSDDFFLMLGGNDTVYAGGGNDRVLLNQGNDLAYGGDGNDSIYGGQGDDSVFGQGGDDTLFGDLGNDYLSAGSGNNVLFGGPGNDLFAVMNGNDRLHGGAGNDSFHFSGVGGDKIVFGDRGNDTFTLDGTFGNWLLYGGDGTDSFEVRAHQGDLEIETGSAGSYVEVSDVLGRLRMGGGPDRDHWTVEPGTEYRHVIETGSGDDEVHVHGPGSLQSFLRVDLGPGNDVLDLSGYAGDDRQNWYLGTGSDTVFGGGSGGIFHTGGGLDLVQVGSGRVQVMLGPVGAGDGGVEFDGYRPGFDRVRVVDDVGLGDIFGYKGNGLSGTTADTNWLVATDAAYTISSFDNYLVATQADTAKPGFFTFLDGHAQTWFTFDMRSTSGAIKIVDYFNVTSLPQLQLFNVGAGGDLDLLGGD